ncbi:MAG: hypothetical protein R3F59_17660 [Myxococcota bacterium]
MLPWLRDGSVAVAVALLVVGVRWLAGAEPPAERASGAEVARRAAAPELPVPQRAAALADLRARLGDLPPDDAPVDAPALAALEAALEAASPALLAVTCSEAPCVGVYGEGSPRDLLDALAQQDGMADVRHRALALTRAGRVSVAVWPAEPTDADIDAGMVRIEAFLADLEAP